MDRVAEGEFNQIVKDFSYNNSALAPKAPNCVGSNVFKDQKGIRANINL